jgi:hypothetical protein
VRRLANRDHQLDNDLSEVASDIRELEANSLDASRKTGSSAGALLRNEGRS